MSNKVILLVVAAILLIITGVFYFLSMEEETVVEETTTEEIIPTEFSDDAYLYKAGEGGEETGRDAGTPVNEFSQGDIFGAIGYYDIGTEEEVVLNVTDEGQNVIEERVMEFVAREGVGRDFDICCAEVPEEEGSYRVEFVVDGEMVLFLPFEVI